MLIRNLQIWNCINCNLYYICRNIRAYSLHRIEYTPSTDDYSFIYFITFAL